MLHNLQDARKGNHHDIWKESTIPVIIFYKHFLGGELLGTTRKCKIKQQRPHWSLFLEQFLDTICRIQKGLIYALIHIHVILRSDLGRACRPFPEFFEDPLLQSMLFASEIHSISIY